MLLRPNAQDDPIIEILRLAYRRGLALRKEQEKSLASNQELVACHKPIDKLDNNEITESRMEATEQIKFDSA